MQAKQLIEQKALDLGFDQCRFTTADPPRSAEEFRQWISAKHHGEMGYLERNAHKRVDPQQVLAQAQSVITLAVSYGNAAFEAANASLPNTGIVARYARYSDYHDIIGERLKTLTEYVNAIGGEGCRSLWYVDTGPFLERDLAQRAGIGFAGKHTNLISRELGNWFFLSEIITTLSLEPDKPERNRCGTCTRCLSACPTQAIRAPFQLDARRCISYLTIELKGSIPTELRPLIGNRVYGCDDCLAACPWNRFAKEGRLMAEHLGPSFSTPDLIELLGLNDEEFKRRFKGTPVLRTKRRGLLRNVCVALGNIGDVTALPALRKAAQDSEPLIVEHAEWAIQHVQTRVNSQPLTEGS